MSKDKGGKRKHEDWGNMEGGSSSKASDTLRANAEKQWEKDFGRKNDFNHSKTSPFAELSVKGKEPSSSGQPDNGGSGASKGKKPASAPLSPGGKGVGNNAGKGPTPS
jgi:hypothetical protein